MSYTSHITEETPYQCTQHRGPRKWADAEIRTATDPVHAWQVAEEMYLEERDNRRNRGADPTKTPGVMIDGVGVYMQYAEHNWRKKVNRAKSELKAMGVEVED